MAPTKHAILSASKSHQWLECPPSARWEAELGEESSSEAAEEGTLAHAIAEKFLKSALAGRRPGPVPKAMRENPLYKPAMEEHVKTYVDAVLEIRAGMPDDAIVYVEQHLDLTKYVPEGFGTSDCVLIGDGVMHVVDLKYGKGVPVDAVNNPQLRLYALGCLEEFSLLYDIKEVVTHIVQPRLDSITEEHLTVEELYDWGSNFVRPRAELAFAGQGEYTASPDACRWCRCKARCRAYAQFVLEGAKAAFGPTGEGRPANELSPDEVSLILGKAEELKKYTTMLSDYVTAQMLNNGATFPGWKLVEGRSNRKIESEPEVIDILDKAGFTTDKTCHLRGVTDLEELVGKKKLAELLGERIVKPAGKPTLAPESDKRPAFDPNKTAANTFTAVKD